jgi:hypothetical protein
VCELSAFIPAGIRLYFFFLAGAFFFAGALAAFFVAFFIESFSP